MTDIYPKPLTHQENEDLARVGAGTVMGEYLRRFWHPVVGAAPPGGAGPPPGPDPAARRNLRRLSYRKR
jgi:hypothetical protein